MKGKPMLSVERELLGRIAGDSYQDSLRAVGELREIIAASVPEFETDVRKIMLDVVPGPDGMGEEVYAKSVADVETVLAKQGDRLEELEMELHDLKAEQPAPVAVANTMRSVMEITQEASQFYVPGTSNWCEHIADRLNGVTK